MLEPPRISKAALSAALHTHYGLEAASLDFLPLGADSAAWVYRLQAAGGRAYLLKLRQGPVNEAGLLVPRYLCDLGLAHIVAPLRNQSGQLWCTADGFTLMLYPFVAGRRGAERGLSVRQWRDFGAVLRQVQAIALPPGLAARLQRETFVPQWRGTVAALAAHLDGRAFVDPAARTLAAFWRAHQAEIAAVMVQAETQGRRAQAAGADCVLCHADAHTWNVLVDDDEQLWLIDWDETVLAPKERDLMFVIGGIGAGLVGPHDTERFFEGYGPATVDPGLLAYYRAAWAVNDIGAYGGQICFQPQAGAATRQAALEGFMSLFEPGEIMDLALASNGALGKPG